MNSNTEYGVHDTMRNGFTSTITNAAGVHPLERLQKNSQQDIQKKDFAIHRSMQGLHMPIHMSMERSIASKMQRLPGLPSSHIHLRTIMGMGDVIGPEDIFNDPSMSENAVEFKI